MGDMPAVAPGTGPLAPEFNGIDPALMQGFITDLEQAGQVIAEHTEAIRRELAAVDLPAAGLAPVREIGGWAEEQLPRLRQRVETITSAPAVLLGGGLTGYQESALLAPAEAQKQGSDLGKRFAGIDLDEFSLLGPYASDRMAALVGELKAHQHDSNFTAAFFAALGPADTRTLTTELRRLADAENSVDVARRAFATALRGGAKVAGFAGIMRAMQEAKENDLDGVVDLLRPGAYPTEWLAGMAAPVLAAGSRVRGRSLATLLNLLGENPAAARLAIGAASGIGPVPASAKLPFGLLSGLPQPWDSGPKLARFLESLNERSRGTKETAAGFGRLLAAASGAYDEKQGEHSPEAVFFTYTLMTTMDDLKLGDATRLHLSEIAGSYAPEITLGADIGAVDMTKDSGLYPTPGFFEPTIVAGLRGAFRLSPEDTFRFLTTFAGANETRVPFQDGMGRLTERLLPEASRQVKSTKDVTALDDLFTVLGNVRGFELAAAVRVLKPQDEAAESAKDAEDFLVGAFMGVAGLFPPLSIYARTWTAISTGKAALDTYGSQPEEKAAKMLELDGTETLGRQYEVAHLLAKQGFTPKVPPTASSIADANGSLRPFDDIVKQGNAGMAVLEQWFINNGMGTSDELVSGQLSRRQARNFDGSKGFAFQRPKLYVSKLTTD
ncbi:hypothetical protein SAMN05216276_100872 [Streptosporangium subroseum]|uniref:Uncharacterized protein n=2 Tax=Streptosporangium subroseum TaxID=106412 RepID=A0A239DV25_9ACTN|nr:hypothetical protein SAMN05216276_100872 [Streptosporangium subroseum]